MAWGTLYSSGALARAKQKLLLVKSLLEVQRLDGGLFDERPLDEGLLGDPLKEHKEQLVGVGRPPQLWLLRHKQLGT